jgi:hypothetical protein
MVEDAGMRQHTLRCCRQPGPWVNQKAKEQTEGEAAESATATSSHHRVDLVSHRYIRNAMEVECESLVTSLQSLVFSPDVLTND